MDGGLDSVTAAGPEPEPADAKPLPGRASDEPAPREPRPWLTCLALPPWLTADSEAPPPAE